MRYHLRTSMFHAGADVAYRRTFDELSQRALLTSIARDAMVTIETITITPRTKGSISMQYYLWWPLMLGLLIYVPVLSTFTVAVVALLYPSAIEEALIVVVLVGLAKSWMSSISQFNRERASIQEARTHAGTKELSIDLVEKKLVVSETLSVSRRQGVERVPLTRVRLLASFREGCPDSELNGCHGSIDISAECSPWDVATPWARDRLSQPIRVYEIQSDAVSDRHRCEIMAAEILEALNSRISADSAESFVFDESTAH